MKRIIIALMCILAVLLVACRNDVALTESQEPMTSTGIDPPEPMTSPGIEPPPIKTIYYITVAMGSAYWNISQAGAIDAGKDFGVNVIVTGIPDEQRIDDQIMLLQNAVLAKADAIVLRPTHSYALADEVSKTYLAGIPIVITDVSIHTEDYTAIVKTDNYAAGETAAKELIRLLKEEKNFPETQSGTIAVQIGTSGSQTIIDRNAGFKAYWDSNAPEAWVVMWDKMQVNDGNIEKAVDIAKNVLTSEPELIAMYAPNNGSTVGCVWALMEMDRTDIAMLGFDFSDDINVMIREGNFTVSTLLHNQYSWGYESVRLAVEAANGVLASEKIIDTGVTVVTIDNIDSPDVRKEAYGGR